MQHREWLSSKIQRLPLMGACDEGKRALQEL